MYANIPGNESEEKPVYDWHRRVVGTVHEVQKDPKTHAARDLIVTLSPEARQALGAPEGVARIPMTYVSGIRRESVTLDRGMNELNQIEFMHKLLNTP